MKQIAKFVVGLGQHVAPTDIEEGMRVGVDRTKYFIHIPLPPKIDPSVTMMTVEEKPDVTYNDVGGSKEQVEKLREVVELPLLHPEKFVQLGIDPPKGVLCYGPPGTGKTLLARAVANRTDACFIRVIGVGSLALSTFFSFSFSTPKRSQKHFNTFSLCVTGGEMPVPGLMMRAPCTASPKDGVDSPPLFPGFCERTLHAILPYRISRQRRVKP